MDGNYSPGERAALRAAWFERGADAVQRVWPEAPRCYVCPLCMRGFARAAIDHRVLTLEHVPAQKLGGSPLVLTCIGCNNRAGGKYDGHAVNREHLFDFDAATMRGPVRMTVELGGVAMTAKVVASGKSVALVGPGRTDHATVDKLKVSFHDNPSIRITFPAFRQREALLSWWRAGYLAAFACFGYRYIIRRDVKTIRGQLLEENIESLRVFSTTLPGNDPGMRRVLVIRRPVRALLVQMGRHGVILPWITSSPHLYQRIARRGGKAAQFIANKSRPWPVEPEFAMDLVSAFAATGPSPNLFPIR